MRRRVRGRFLVAEEFHQPHVPQHLQLLADFVAHVAVGGMQFFQVRGEGVDILKGELVLVERPDDVENVERPIVRVSRYAWSERDGYAILRGIDASGFVYEQTAGQPCHHR